MSSPSVFACGPASAIRRSQGGFTLVELAIAIAIIGVIAAIATTNLRESRKRANEASAIQALRGVTAAQEIFAQQDKDGDGIRDYAYQYSVNGHPGLGPTLSSTKLLSLTPKAAVGQNPGILWSTAGGYVIWGEGVSSDGDPTGGYEYWAWLVPTINGGNPALIGDRTFYVNQTGVIRVRPQVFSNADANSPPLGK